MLPSRPLLLAAAFAVASLSRAATFAITYNATPAEVQTALNAVQTKINADHQARNPPVPNGLGFAVAAGANPDEYKIVFNDIGDQALITGEGGGTADHEIQTINLSGIESGGPNGFAANTFDLVFDPDGSGPLPSDVTPQLTLTGTDSTDATAIQTALNALPGIKTTQPPVPPGSGAVAVTTTAHGVFDVTFNFFGDQSSIGGLSQVGPDAQHLGVTSRLHYNATAADIQTALALVSEVPITVTNGATPGAFTLAFAGNGNQPDTTGVGYFHETQNVDVYAIGDFVATFGTKSTQRLAPPPDPILHPADAAAAAAAIDAQLELLPGIVALNGPVGDKVEVAIGPNSSFKVLFHADGDQPALSGTQFEAMTASNIINGINRNGTATNVEVQEISYIQKGAFNEAYYGAANLVGAITDINEIDSNIFHYLHNGVLQSSKDGPFQPGDTPIDGLIMAKKFNQATVNFTPEAKFTFAGFFDNDNLI